MGVLRETGAARSGGFGLVLFRISFAIAAYALLAGEPGAAGPAPGAIVYHATVFNGDLVGSAFALSPTIAVTNAHVVEGRQPGGEVRLIASASGTMPATGVILAISRHMDLAILQIPRGFMTPVPGIAPEGVKGEAVVAAGVDASGGAQTGRRLELQGVVSTPRRDIDVFGPGLVAYIPGVRPGFSGGPLLDRSSRLIGMVTAIRDRSDGASPARGADASRGTGAEAYADEAYVLRGREIRLEVLRLLEGWPAAQF
jgi:S1-C subfamily serine protease